MAPIRIGIPACLAARDDLLDLVGAADVARVDADGGDAPLDRLQREARVEVDVGDHRDRREADDPRSASASSVFGTATRTISQPADASAAIWAVVACDVVRLRQRHRLDDDGRAAADRDAADRI